uniref:Uncharacterized protein n=1 Tax=Callorhinchus milii TaxID=7868 RepID=A0A4W3I9M3_CALMI
MINTVCILLSLCFLISRLTDNNLTDACTKDLVSALNTNRSLTALNLGSNELGDSGVKQLCLALRNPKCKIKTWYR